MIVTSDGRIAGDIQPLVRFNVSLPVRARRQPPDGALGRRRPHGHGVLRDAHAGDRWRRGRAAGGAAAVRDRSAGRHVPGRARGGRQRHPAARGRRPRPRGRLQPQEDQQLHRPDRQRRRVSSSAPSSTTARSRTAAARINIDDEGNAPGLQRADRERHPARLHPGPHEHEALRRAADGQRPPPVVPALPDAAHDEHVHAGRPVEPGGHHPLRRPRHLLRLVQRRAGQHHATATSSSASPRAT